MHRTWLAGLAGAALLAGGTPAFADAEAPAKCEWRPAKSSKSPPSLYCPAKDGAMRYARSPQGFSPETIGKARAGDAAAMNLLGLFYLDGPESARDPAAGQDWLGKAEAAGSPEARFNLALALDSGKGGVARDPAAAAALYRKAAEAGDAEAAVNLGEMHLAGRGVARDDAEALRLMQSEDKVAARYNIAAMTFEGRGVPADKPAGVALLRKAGEEGSEQAAWRLGRIYETGDGAPASVPEAILWTRKSGESTAKVAKLILSLGYLILPERTLADAKAGDPQAQLTMALELLDGRRLKRDPKAASVLLMSAMKAGIPLVAYTLGGLYADGDGVRKDEKLALELLTAGVASQARSPWDTFTVFRTPPKPGPASAKTR